MRILIGLANHPAGGETVRDMQTTTGCKINVSQPSGRDIEREIELVGSDQSIDQAKAAIMEKVRAVVSTVAESNFHGTDAIVAGEERPAKWPITPRNHTDHPLTCSHSSRADTATTLPIRSRRATWWSRSICRLWWLSKLRCALVR